MVIREKVICLIIAAAIGHAGCTSESGNLTNNNRTNADREASNAFNTAANTTSVNGIWLPARAHSRQGTTRL